MPPALRIESLWKCYVAGVRGCSARAWVLRGLSLHLQQGERVAIVGGAGSGKSTLAACVLGLRRADWGRIEVSGTIEIVDLQDVGMSGSRESTSPPPHLQASTILYLTREAIRVSPWADRVLLLRDGRLHDKALEPALRVAERALR